MPKLSESSTLNPDGLIAPTEHWKLQWERVVRWKIRVELLKSKRINEESNYYDVIDSVIALLQNCYHLREWITISHPNLKQKVNSLFKNNFELECCRDVCNGFKHKNLTNYSVDKNFTIFRSYDYFAKKIGLNKSPIHYKIDFSDETNSRTYDLFDFANKCFLAWESFIERELK